MLSQAPADHDPSVTAVSAALRHAGLTTGDIDTHRAMVGPLLQRWSVRSTRGEHVWVDLPGSRQVDGMAPVADPELGDLLAGLGDGTTVAALPIPLSGLGWAYPLDGPGELLVGLALRTAAAAEGEPGRMELAGRALGGFLRRLHGSPCRRRASGPPPPVRRLATGTDTGALVNQHRRWRRVLERWIDDPGHEASPLHGQLGLGHVLVAQPAGLDHTPRCVVTGWSGFVSGRPAFDVGHLIGDLLEVAALVPPDAPGRPQLLAAAAAARAGYEAAGEALAPDFWATAASAACVKVLDHDLRLHQAFGGSHHEQGTDLAPIAGALLDPSCELGGVFA